MESQFSSAEAVATLASDDPELFRAFVDHYQHPLFGFIGRMGFSQADAEDLAQDIFLKAWRYRASYNPDKARPSTWLFTIARNTAIDKLQAAAKEHTATTETEPAASSAHQPDYQLQQHQAGATLSQALLRLSIEDRCAIALFYTEEMSGAQAASIMQCNASAFRTCLSRAREKLKAILLSMDAI